ncbi:MAG TPA: LPS export ABC transporter periplasmic protein LptC [Flavobacteriales bacterium]|nr:LPS export ABC transporter periplasmic protein LptC [Flavobacteriales bacterium]
MTKGRLIGLCAGLCILLACKNDLDRVAAIEVRNDGAVRITQGAEYIYSDSGLVRNRLRAGTIREYAGERPRTELQDGVELTFFDPDGKEGSRLTARRGRIDQATGKMVVEEKVVFKNTRGEQLETELLTWGQDSGKVYTDRPVMITRDQDIIYGQGLDAAEDFSRYAIRKVTGTLFMDRNDTLAPGNTNN